MFRGMILSSKAEAAIEPYRIVALADDGRAVKTASAPTDAIYGVNDDCQLQAGDHADVTVSGVAAVEYGGTISAGDWVTTDAQGRAVVGAGRVVGIAHQSGVTGDIGAVLVSLTKV